MATAAFSTGWVPSWGRWPRRASLWNLKPWGTLGYCFTQRDRASTASPWSYRKESFSCSSEKVQLLKSSCTQCHDCDLMRIMNFFSLIGLWLCASVTLEVAEPYCLFYRPRTVCCPLFFCWFHLLLLQYLVWGIKGVLCWFYTWGAAYLSWALWANSFIVSYLALEGAFQNLKIELWGCHVVLNWASDSITTEKNPKMGSIQLVWCEPSLWKHQESQSSL